MIPCVFFELLLFCTLCHLYDKPYAIYLKTHMLPMPRATLRFDSPAKWSIFFHCDLDKFRMCNLLFFENGMRPYMSCELWYTPLG